MGKSGDSLGEICQKMKDLWYVKEVEILKETYSPSHEPREQLVENGRSHLPVLLPKGVDRSTVKVTQWVLFEFGAPLWAEFPFSRTCSFPGQR